jgi:hypothetical protein
MSTVVVTYKCGHTGRTEIRRTHTRRPPAQVRSGRLCRECWIKAHKNDPPHFDCRFDERGSTPDMMAVVFRVRNGYPLRDQLRTLGFAFCQLDHRSGERNTWQIERDYDPQDPESGLFAMAEAIGISEALLSLGIEDRSTDRSYLIATGTDWSQRAKPEKRRQVIKTMDAAIDKYAHMIKKY